MATQLKIGFLGAGKMATALAKGFIHAEIVVPKEIIASDPYESARKNFAEEMARKPWRQSRSREICERLDPGDQAGPGCRRARRNSDAFTKNHLLISIAAGVTISKLENAFARRRARHPRHAQHARARRRVRVRLRARQKRDRSGRRNGEKTFVRRRPRISGQGKPARRSDRLERQRPGICLSIHRSVERRRRRLRIAARHRDEARRANRFGRRKMVLETGQHPGAFKDQVTSPGGTTIEGLHELEKGKLRATVISAVRAATEKSKKLGQN